MASKAIIRQFGSKARVAQQLLNLVPRDCPVWVEVFCGTASVTLAKPPSMHKEEHLNDLNGEIVNLFRVLRDDGQRNRLCGLIELTPWAEAEYLDCRLGAASADPVERARRYLVCSWQGMAGSSLRHTSWIAVDGATKRRTAVWAELPERLHVVAARLMNVALHCRPAASIVERFAKQEGAVLFVDPPYPESAINSRGAYLVTMTDEDHEAFALQLRDVRCAVLMTMAEGTIYDRVLEGWQTLPLKVRGLRNAVKTERIFMNYDPSRLGLFAGAA